MPRIFSRKSRADDPPKDAKYAKNGTQSAQQQQQQQQQHATAGYGGAYTANNTSSYVHNGYDANNVQKTPTAVRQGSTSRIAQVQYVCLVL
jgi:hypothetical protein